MEEHPPIERFVFNLRAGEHAARDLQMKIDALEERIDRIVKKVEVRGIPLLGHILGLTHEQDELDRLGKALQRVAALMPELDEMKKRKGILELATSDPTWLAATFGDFDDELDTFIKQLDD